jgi:hypothetical protein
VCVRLWWHCVPCARASLLLSADRRLLRSWRQSPSLPHMHRDFKQCGMQMQYIHSTRHMHPHIPNVFPSIHVHAPCGTCQTCSSQLAGALRFTNHKPQTTIHKPQTATPTFEPFFFNWLPMTACVFELICDFFCCACRRLICGHFITMKTECQPTHCVAFITRFSFCTWNMSMQY